MTVGRLVVINGKTLQVSFTNKKGNPVQPNIKEAELSQPLQEQKKKAISELDGLEVELEEDKGQPTQIREKGQEWKTPILKNHKAKSSPSPAGKNLQKQQNTVPGDFHNPYNFVPALSRNHTDPDLGDNSPAGHGSYRHNYWSGSIALTLTTVTPLLIPDAANVIEVENGHKTYPLRLDSQEKPYLPPTSIKGMLRTAYEIITNSRFSIFAEKHHNRLAYRSKPTRSIYPARVEERNEIPYLRIMVDGPAKLLRYDTRNNNRDRGQNTRGTKYENTNTLPQQGDHVWVKIENNVVEKIRQYQNKPKDTHKWKEGWVCVTGANIDNKKNERVFIVGQNDEYISITPEINSLWSELISDYQTIHKKELEKRRDNHQSPQDYLGDEPGKTAWSRQIWNSDEVKLQPGTLCYVDFQGRKITSDKILAIQPVTISRRLYNISPEELLPENLKPPTCINQLSPAERVFGWVKSKGKGSYKGNLRVHNVTCITENSKEIFGDQGLPLAILSTPQPQQARFYQAKNKQGQPLDNGIDKDQGYFNSDQGLRGRKVYPHHRHFFQEYLRINDERDDQNRSIKAWVKPQVQFEFTIDVTNLSNVELGALLRLLDLPDNHYHRLGGGKPLGFGSVHIKINWDKTDLRTGQEWKEYYSSLLPNTRNFSKQLCKNLVNQFQNAIVRAYGENENKQFEQVEFIQAFYQAAKGFDDNLPIHYPRTTQNPNPQGEGFDWFVDNESMNQDNGGRKLALPLLTQDNGLPYNPKG